MNTTFARVGLLASGLFLSASGCAPGCGREEGGSKDLLLLHPSPAGTAHPGASPGSTEGGGGGRVAGTGASPTATPDLREVQPRPAGCKGKVLLEERWTTERFPQSARESSDLACRFTLSCCGTVIQSWKYVYLQAGGPSGVAGGSSRRLDIDCDETDSVAFNDLDGDGIPNVEDPNPRGPGPMEGIRTPAPSPSPVSTVLTTSTGR